MFDPVSLGIAAAALLATKFGEEFAKDAGASTWSAVKRLRTAVGEKFRNDEETTIVLENLPANPTPQMKELLSARISQAAANDERFRSELVGALTTLEQTPSGERFLAQAFDDSKQINIGGDNYGTISI
ncbi:hypothetical protein ACQPW1_11490 [Nocardia sp. CA-128927]|uniref:hypothetical protein n=1 Tax=Nocardia sp. CA-128927 TaxID=3239975 RepID=UPI003D98352F